MRRGRADSQASLADTPEANRVQPTFRKYEQVDDPRSELHRACTELMTALEENPDVWYRITEPIKLGGTDGAELIDLGIFALPRFETYVRREPAEPDGEMCTLFARRRTDVELELLRLTHS